LDKFQIGVHFLALAAAFALAAPIGWDREKRARSAGLRTFPLVAMASCGFVQASESLLVHSPDGMAKVIEGLITGIGFIGGGAILKQGTTVQGTATAASLWATGAIGVSVGLGSYDVAVTVAVFTFLTLRLLTLVKEEDDIKKDEGGDKSETSWIVRHGFSAWILAPCRRRCSATAGVLHSELWCHTRHQIVMLAASCGRSAGVPFAPPYLASLPPTSYPLDGARY
jgi:putative Mg2+ transporter-C (MgtC) family protein